MMGIGEQEQVAYAPIMDMLENLGVPMVDGILSMPLEHYDDHIGVANYNASMSDELKEFIESKDIKLIGYRQIRNAMRS